MTETNNQHWHCVIDENNIAWLHLDHCENNVNTLSAAVLEELEQQLHPLEQQTPDGLVIVSDKPGGFIAGADVNEFKERLDEDETFTYIQYCQSLFDRLEALSCPTVALIHGYCMGGGTELALACRYRIGVDEPSTRIGLPEINLGIHPGYGGTVRSTRLLGPLAAMDMMLTGRALSVGYACRIGLLDYKVPQRHLHNAARQIIRKKPAEKKRKWTHQLLSHRLVRPLIASQLRKRVMKKATEHHYPAPYALINLWEQHANTDQMMQQEARSVAKLIGSSTAQNLIRVFFLQTAMKENGKKTPFKARHVHVIGAGTMGGDIAAWCVLKGLTVTLQDRTPESIAPAVRRAATLFRKKLKQPRLVTAAMDRLIPDVQGYGLVNTDVVVEAIFENLEAKQQLFREIEPIVRSDTLLCTNTSSIPLQDLGESLDNPSRLVGLHFFNPVEKMQLIEVVQTENTDINVVNQACAFSGQIAKLPLKVKSSPGFLVNRVLMPYLLEAAFMVQEGIDPAIIDKAALAFGMPMGPIELADKVGLDICLSVAEILTCHFGGSVPDILNDRVSSGNLGLKSKRGFYEYNKKGHPVKNKTNSSVDQIETVQDRLILRLLNEAVACLREGIVESADMLDAGIIFGTGFAPFTGGPIQYLHNLKLDKQRRRFEEFNKQYSDRFIMDEGWENLLS